MSEPVFSRSASSPEMPRFPSEQRLQFGVAETHQSEVESLPLQFGKFRGSNSSSQPALMTNLLSTMIFVRFCVSLR